MDSIPAGLVGVPCSLLLCGKVFHPPLFGDAGTLHPPLKPFPVGG